MAEEQRFGALAPDPNGTPAAVWGLTPTSKSDAVKLVVRPCRLPVVFVPGIMGSNLCTIEGDGGKGPAARGAPVWRLDTTFGLPLGLVWSMAMKGPGERQLLLHPKRVMVDDRGDVPNEALRERGWGEVAESSYMKFLTWLEAHLNQVHPNPAFWSDFRQSEATIGPTPQPGSKPRLSPGVKMAIDGQPFGAELPFESLKTDDLLARARYDMPVYAFGYNWLAGIDSAAKELESRIDAIIESNDRDPFWCQQVVLVTHSMGGLVARACAELPGMPEKIAGIVHGVMPSRGSPIAYRRCKVGMRDEDWGAGLVIGHSGPEVTAVFAQAPGALQLLPNKNYRQEWPQWLVLPTGSEAKPTPSKRDDPYAGVYLRKDVWWGLIRPEWLKPAGGVPITWTEYCANLDEAEGFHDALAGKFHHNSYVIYGATEGNSFETIRWDLRKGLQPEGGRPPTPGEVARLTPGQVRYEGTSTLYVGGEQEVSVSPIGLGVTAYQTSYWELHCDSTKDSKGDGTVPESSGHAPLEDGGESVKQQFAMTGFGHEEAYKDADVQRATLYAITRIAATAKKP